MSTTLTIRLALQDLTAPLARTLASFLGPAQLFIICSVWSCSVKMSSAHCLAPRVVAALALRALNPLHDLQG